LLYFLIGMAITALAIIGWGYGNLFVCVFLSLPVGLAALMSATSDYHGPSNLPFFIALMLVFIWAPYLLRRRGVRR
jgi:hypothetical protein